MSDLTKKILESGLVDEHTAALMERWGYLPEGAAAIAKDKSEELQKATREQLSRLAEEIGTEVERRLKLKESMLDMEKIRWPVMVDIWNGIRTTKVAHAVTGVIDRMGRYYFRPLDVEMVWFRPGFHICRFKGETQPVYETILESTELYMEDQVMAIQVTTKMGE